MVTRPPGSTLTVTLFPSTTLFRSERGKRLGVAPLTRRVARCGHVSGQRLMGTLPVVDLAPAVEAGLHAGEVRERSEEHTSELQSLMRISYAVFCLKKKNPHFQS